MNRRTNLRSMGVVLCLLIASVPVQAQLSPFGLEKETVVSLAAERNDYAGGPVSPLLFALTDRSEVLQNSAFGSGSTWESLGSPGAGLLTLAVQHWGAGPMDGLHLFAAGGGYPLPTTMPLIYRRGIRLTGVADTVWTPADSGIDRSSGHRIRALNAWYYTGHEIPQRTLAGGEGGGWWGSPAGIFWTQGKFDNAGCVIAALDIAPHWRGTLAWAAGSLSLSPAAFKSTDNGETWQKMLQVQMMIEGEATAVAINPRSTDSVYVLAAGTLLLTPDGGKHWDTLFVPAQMRAARAVAIDPETPETVYLAGDVSQQVLMLMRSRDGGRTWTDLYLPGGMNIAGALSLLFVDTEDPFNPGVISKALFIGTRGTGVWKYNPGTPVPVALPPSVPLVSRLDIAPQPVRSSTVFTCTLADAGDAELRVHDVLGRTVAVCLSGRFDPGVQRAVFDAASLAPGLYIAALRSASGMVTRTFVVTRGLSTAR